MTWELEIADARADLERRKAHCRDAYDATSGWQPMLQIFGAYNFHQACNELRESEARLRVLLARQAAA